MRNHIKLMVPRSPKGHGHRTGGSLGVVLGVATEATRHCGGSIIPGGQEVQFGTGGSQCHAN